jgi:hypothetical protein
MKTDKGRFGETLPDPFKPDHYIQFMDDGSIVSVGDKGMVYAIWDEQTERWDDYGDDPVHVSGWDC